jgi:hypothetical protein
VPSLYSRGASIEKSLVPSTQTSVNSAHVPVLYNHDDIQCCIQHQLNQTAEKHKLIAMASTTPTAAPSSATHRTRSKSPSLGRSRPTTPLRPSSHSSLRDSVQRARGPYTEIAPLELLQEDFAELSDAMADLESNFAQLQVMHESLARFSESFAGFLYGLNMNAFCVDFPEVKINFEFG